MLYTLYTCRESSTNPPFLCKTNPIFPGFYSENDDLTKKQTQFKPNQSRFKPNISPKTIINYESKPKQTQSSKFLVRYMSESFDIPMLTLVFPLLIYYRILFSKKSHCPDNHEQLKFNKYKKRETRCEI